MTKVMPTAAGGICRTSVLMVEKLASVLGEQTFDGHFRFFDFGWVVLTLHGQADLRFLESVLTHRWW